MMLCLDIGNTQTHAGIADHERVTRTVRFDTRDWFSQRAQRRLADFIDSTPLSDGLLASVVPEATAKAQSFVEQEVAIPCVPLTARNAVGIGIDYPRVETIGADRLANAMAATRLYGAPVVVVDFGTAVTFDVVDNRKCYVGGVIAPGLGAMTGYLYEKTALLPQLDIREPVQTIGKSTEEAMLIGTVKGYRGLVSYLLEALRKELKRSRLTVVATGGYAELMARELPLIETVNPDLTLEGLRLLGLEIRRQHLMAESLNERQSN